MATSVPEVTRKYSFSDRHTTYLQKEEYAYSWTIHSFREWLAEFGTQTQCSPSFPEEPSTYKWKLDFHNRLDTESKTGAFPYCGVYLTLLNASRMMNVKYEVTMSNGKNKQIWKSSGNALFGPQSTSWGWGKLIPREILLRELEDVALVISYKIEVTAGTVNERKTVEVSVGKDLSNDLASLLEGSKFSDATITVGAEKFLVHKGILASRSSVFAAMFEHNMTENIKNIVDIVDIEPEVFAKLLRYIYTDKVENLSEFAHQLFAAATNYCILPLKTLCQQSILANLSVQNASKTLMLADEHHAEEMKTRVLQFLSSGAARGVTDTADWKSMARTHPHLVSEAFEAKGSIARTAAP